MMASSLDAGGTIDHMFPNVNMLHGRHMAMNVGVWLSCIQRLGNASTATGLFSLPDLRLTACTMEPAQPAPPSPPAWRRAIPYGREISMVAERQVPEAAQMGGPPIL